MLSIIVAWGRPGRFRQCQPVIEGNNLVLYFDREESPPSTTISTNHYLPSEVFPFCDSHRTVPSRTGPLRPPNRTERTLGENSKHDVLMFILVYFGGMVFVLLMVVILLGKLRMELHL